MSKYYIPSVVDGVLSWTPSEPDMPAVESAIVIGPEGKVGIRGPQGIPGIAGADGTVVFENLTQAQLQMITGPKGECGVHVGVDAPTSGDRYIWIDTDEEIDEELATREYVDQAIVKNISGGEVVLDAYATKQFVGNYVNDVLLNYYTKNAIDNDYYTKAQIDAMFAKLAASSSEEV